jgi:hypothetical protein
MFLEEEDLTQEVEVDAEVKNTHLDVLSVICLDINHLSV